MKEMEINAKVDELNTVLDFIHSDLDTMDCSMKASIQLDTAVEELFVNVANYAYGENTGTVTVSCGYDTDKELFLVQFTDTGIPFDPLNKPDPDTTLSAEERPIGGLGIMMIKKLMDMFVYEYTDGKNVNTIGKKIS